MHKYVQRKTKLCVVDDSNRYELGDEIYNANGVIVKKGTYRMDDGNSVDILVEIVDENNDSHIVLSSESNVNNKIYNRKCGNPFICTYGVFDMKNTIVPGKYIVVYEHVKGHKFSGLDYNVNVETYILYVVYNLIYSVHICGTDDKNLFIGLDDVIYKNSDVSIVNVYSSTNSTLSNIVEQLIGKYPDCSIALNGLFQYMLDFDTNDRNYIDNLEIMLGIVLNMISYRVLK
jgi:ribosomal protein S17